MNITELIIYNLRLCVFATVIGAHKAETVRKKSMLNRQMKVIKIEKELSHPVTC